MRIRMKGPSPGASAGFCRTDPDKDNCSMIEDRDVELAKTHGWIVCHEGGGPEVDVEAVKQIHRASDTPGRTQVPPEEIKAQVVLIKDPEPPFKPDPEDPLPGSGVGSGAILPQEGSTEGQEGDPDPSPSEEPAGEEGAPAASAEGNDEGAPGEGAEEAQQGDQGKPAKPGRVRAQR